MAEMPAALCTTPLAALAAMAALPLFSNTPRRGWLCWLSWLRWLLELLELLELLWLAERANPCPWPSRRTASKSPSLAAQLPLDHHALVC